MTALFACFRGPSNSKFQHSVMTVYNTHTHTHTQFIDARVAEGVQKCRGNSILELPVRKWCDFSSSPPSFAFPLHIPFHIPVVLDGKPLRRLVVAMVTRSVDECRAASPSAQTSGYAAGIKPVVESSLLCTGSRYRPLLMALGQLGE